MIDTDKYEGHTRGPWKSIPYCKSIRDKLLHGGIILASSGIGDGSNYSPFIITDDDVVIWPKDTDGKNVVEYEHGAKGPILHIYYEEMMANTRLTMAAPDLLAEVKRHKNIIGKFDEFMCNNWTPENAHSLWNELLEMKKNEKRNSD